MLVASDPLAAQSPRHADGAVPGGLVDSTACFVPIPSEFVIESSKPIGKQLIHRHLPIIALSSCLDGEGSLLEKMKTYQAPEYRILRHEARVLVVEYVMGDVSNRSLIVANSHWRQLTMIFKSTPEVLAELDRIEREFSRFP